MNFVSNIIWNSVEGFVEAGTRTAGEYAGNALIKAGDLIENGGRGVGNRLERTASGYGTKISGQGYQPAGKALPPTARKAAVKRSNSSPASSKAVGPTSKTPIGANKYPGGKALSGVGKQVTSTQKAIGGVTGSATKAVGGVTGGAQKTLGGVPGNAQKTIGGVTGGARSTVGTVTGGAGKTVGGVAAKSLPKPYPQNNTNNLPKPNGATTSYPSEKKAAVKPGQPRPFTPPTAAKSGQGVGAKAGQGIGAAAGDKKPTYPGTNTLVGEGKKTPVRAQKYKPMERMKGTAERGKVEHIAV